jgi:hypothetical protein
MGKRFRDGDGRCQLSFERVAREAGIINLSAVREALTALKSAGWIIAKRVPSSLRNGLQYRPAMSVPLERGARAPVIVPSP